MLAKDIPQILERQHLPSKPGLIKVVETHEATVAGIHEQQFQPLKQEQEIAAARHEAVAQADAELVQLLETDAELVRLTQEKAKIEAAALGASETTWQQRLDQSRYSSESERWAAFQKAQERVHHQLQVTAELSGRLAEVRDLADPNDLAAAYEDAALTGDDRTIRAVGRVVLQRLHVEAAEVPEGPRRVALQAARRKLQASHSAWLHEHPSAGDQRRQVEEAIGARTGKLRDAHRWTLQFAGLR
jgi:hypothetical protein